MDRRVPSLEKLVRFTGFRPATPLPFIIDKVAEYVHAGRQSAARPVLGAA
jgi:hypothetical protein